MRLYYEDDSVTLWHGDMREVVPTLGTFDCIVTDPPYGNTALDWDRWPDGWLDVVSSAADSMWCWLPFRAFATPPFRGVEFAATGWKLSHEIEGEWTVDHAAWEKHNGSGFAADRFKIVHEIAGHWYRLPWADTHHDVPTTPDATARQVRRKARPAHMGYVDESSYTSEDGGPRLMRSVIRVRSMHGRAIHPTEKPVGVLDPLIQYACPGGGTILDPFAGSGSTAEAARLTGRRAVLVEADERYCERIQQRMTQAVLIDAASPSNSSPVGADGKEG